MSARSACPAGFGGPKAPGECFIDDDRPGRLGIILIRKRTSERLKAGLLTITNFLNH